VHESKYHGAFVASTSRRSTRRLLDSVALLVPRRSTEPVARRSQHVCVHPTHGLICTQAPAAGKATAVMFWGKYAKGDYRTMVHVSYLMRALPELQALRSA